MPSFPPRSPTDLIQPPTTTYPTALLGHVACTAVPTFAGSLWTIRSFQMEEGKVGSDASAALSPTNPSLSCLPIPLPTVVTTFSASQIPGGTGTWSSFEPGVDTGHSGLQTTFLPLLFLLEGNTPEPALRHGV